MDYAEEAIGLGDQDMQRMRQEQEMITAACAELAELLAERDELAAALAVTNAGLARMEAKFDAAPAAARPNLCGDPAKLDITAQPMQVATAAAAGTSEGHAEAREHPPPW